MCDARRIVVDTGRTAATIRPGFADAAGLNPDVPRTPLATLGRDRGLGRRSKYFVRHRLNVELSVDCSAGGHSREKSPDHQSLAKPVMEIKSVENSPQLYAQIGGALYLAIIVLGAFAEGFVNNKLIVSGDAATTAANILAAPQLWRLGVAGNFLVVLCAVPLLWIEYLLLRPVSKQLVLLAVLFNLVSLAVEAISKLFLLVVMPTLGNAEYLKAFEPQQLQILANLALKSHDIAFNIALIFFGCTCLVNGYLIFRSGYFPKLIGVLMQVAGLSYLTACFAALFAPTFADLIIPAILVPPLVGESSFCLWLLVKGVNITKWKERVSMAGGI
jgi:hypothetical protein